jgi:hypothetical protein
MAGMRAAERGASPDPKGAELLRACLDLVEHLGRQSLDVTTAEVETTLGVLERAFGELGDDAATPGPVSTALKNAIGKLRALKLEMTAK